MSQEPEIQKWIESADAWIADQGSAGDWSRRAILDPALEKVLGDVDGQAVLDLGCGEGRYARRLHAQGAQVTGLDPVPKFIRQARELDPESCYLEARAEAMPLEDNSFDLILSYLSLIDIADPRAASSEIRRVLRPQGRLVIVTISNVASCTPSWVKDSTGRKVYRTVDRYMEHFAMDLEWRGIRIRNYHRPLSYTLGLFLEHGFVLTRFLEPLPDAGDPNYEDEYRVPTFQILCLQKQA